MSIYDQIAQGGAVVDVAASLAKGQKLADMYNDARENFEINKIGKKYSEMGNQIDPETGQPVGFQHDQFLNDIYGINPAKAREYYKSFSEGRNGGGGRKIIGMTYDPTSKKTFAHFLDSDDNIKNEELQGSPTSIVNSDPDRRGSQAWSTGFGTNAADYGDQNPFNIDNQPNQTNQQPLDMQGSDFIDNNTTPTTTTQSSNAPIRSKADIAGNVTSQTAKATNDAEITAGFDKSLQLMTPVMFKMDQAISSMDKDPNADLGRQFTAFAPTFAQAFGSSSANTDMLLKDIGVNYTLMNTANTKGAISDMEMELFSSGVPSPTASKKVWLDWMKNVSVAQKKLNAWKKSGYADMTDPNVRQKLYQDAGINEKAEGATPVGNTPKVMQETMMYVVGKDTLEQFAEKATEDYAKAHNGEVLDPQLIKERYFSVQNKGQK